MRNITDDAGNLIQALCGNCRFFENHACNTSNACTRRSPVLVVTEFGPDSRYPVVPFDNWCGEYERKKE